MTDSRPAWLSDYASDTFSQNGEDGVIAKILSLLDVRDRWCVEFGAWDGVHLSNVRKLILEEGYSAVLIEADERKFAKLRANYADQPRVKPLLARVGLREENGLDRLLTPYGIPRDFDLLSIDIDGNDYHAWKAVQDYRPKVVCVEFNPTIPNEVHFVQEADPGIHRGASLRALCGLAREKGYELVCVLLVNAFFVDRAYFERFGIEDNDPSRLRRDLSLVTWLFSGYDGTVHLAGYGALPWHGVRYDEGRAQLLPSVLRRFPDTYTALEAMLLRVWRRLRSPRR
jgi:hypothetical protein